VGLAASVRRAPDGIGSDPSGEESLFVFREQHAARPAGRCGTKQGGLSHGGGDYTAGGMRGLRAVFARSRTGE